MSARALVLRSVTRRLREIPGAVVVLERVRQRFLVSDKTVVINDFDGDLKIEVSLGGHMGSQIFWYGSYSRHVLRVLRLLLKPGGTMVDVGANMGEVTLVAAKRVGPTGSVHAFEPVDAVHARLARNVDLNGLGQVSLHRIGLSDAPGTADIFTATTKFEDGTVHEGLSTIFPGGERTSRVQQIRLRTLDELVEEGTIPRIDVLKIDVEGAEFAVLRGAEKTLRTLRPWVILEVNSGTAGAGGHTAKDPLSLLSDAGYTFFVIDRTQPLRRLDPDRLAKFQNVLAAPPGATHPLLGT